MTTPIVLGTARANVLADLIGRGVNRDRAEQVAVSLTDEEVLAYKARPTAQSAEDDLVRDIGRKLLALPYGGLVDRPTPRSPAALLAWLDAYTAELTAIAERHRTAAAELSTIKRDLAAFRRVLGTPWVWS